MSGDLVELVRSGFEAASRGDVEVVYPTAEEALAAGGGR
jgi:hypothetical protein